MLPSTLALLAVVIVSEVLALELQPKFNAITKNVTVVVGHTAILPCSVKALGNYKIVWVSPEEKTLTFEDRRITEDERVSLERPYISEWNLHVREVVMKDTGVYLCQINTNPVQVRPVQLIVQQPSTIIDKLSSLEEIDVVEGETVQLVCNVTGFPTPEVSWYRIPKGLIEGEDREKKNIGANGEVLMIHNVSRYCDDDYECVAFNGVLPADRRIMRVRVQFHPEVRLPTKKIGQVLGGYTILECEVTAYPSVMTVWKYNGKKITGQGDKYNTEMYTEGPNKITLTLKIESLTLYDYGDYECYSENPLGHDSEIMTLYEYCKKTTPKHIPTTTTTTTMTPWRRRPDRYYNGNHDGDDGINVDDYATDSDDNRYVNSYNKYNNNGRESKLQLRPNGRDRHKDGDDVEDTNGDPVISPRESSCDAFGPAGVTNLGFATVVALVVCWLGR